MSIVDLSRDNPTVSRRVLTLADRLGQALDKDYSSLEVAVNRGGGDVFLTKSVNPEKKLIRESRL
jgi:hypothetical protein